MKTRSRFSKLLTASLAVLLLTGMSPADASAAPREAEETEPGSNLFLDKTATLQDDGTYTIQMEAFSTGESTTVMTQTPTDIVLVLDVSGSMEEDFTYVSGQQWTSVKDIIALTAVTVRSPGQRQERREWADIVMSATTAMQAENGILQRYLMISLVKEMMTPGISGVIPILREPRRKWSP